MPFPEQQGRPYTRAGIEALTPGQVGCYGIYVAGSHWVYVGRGDIRSRLLDHIGGDNPCIVGERPTHYVTMVTRDDSAQEAILVAELKPSCNKKAGG